MEEFIPELNGNDILISYNHNILFSDSILSKIKIGYNIHAASPEFPGRDPHHWAIYAGAKKYGSVLHLIEKKVDSGGIIEAVFFDIKPTFGPIELLHKADIEAEKLIISLIEKILKNEVIEVNKELTWGKNKRSRKDFIEICRITSDVSQKEIRRRIKAFHVEGRKNLYTIIHGYKFYY
ncbi:MAG: formyltransferase family protein [Flavobacteriaceae bacterium]|nr:formyltransferase family protein [Flavobacteriaceae bacterium]